MLKNMKKFKIYFFIFLIFSLLIISFIIASRYLFKRKKEEIKLLNNFPILDVEKLNNIDNDKEKFIIPISVPNFNTNKYDYIITIDHSVILYSKGMEIKEPLFLKIDFFWDTQNTFNNAKDFFDVQFTTNDKNNKREIYKDNNKPCFFPMKENEIQKIIVHTKIQQKDIINSVNEPKLFLVYDYEIVDKQGKTITGGNNFLNQEIQNIN
ncbi:MAG: hypothetical protein Q8781_00085 [Candidatus Phytoplasma stylosanthis]|uniref:hypothetical protein n=1 Tax=Candidatus Phytoplasma stylosanthis TaxID=2798314 RepID=UPI00293A5003|nr:hypothetical protein [Candidatus Phytoplasma stylosanthis]MDV3168069.1 hypothetical protein [Candidatus Phytoplasma stylosanthis]MDV3170693.1 hypothetical protein [Candidatus Phytoplasma stylosanthis]MDV3173676.1 hypothetical protein [Candidatus Phytoplasma stylosanthis]MDV3174335.1 hypothetical protein [Candidatus Phytoplasma stylosanthis]MDV3202676.1 hypothetical protein [Candidatus Phytoplasma stylosanthis]